MLFLKTWLLEFVCTLIWKVHRPSWSTIYIFSASIYILTLYTNVRIDWIIWKKRAVFSSSYMFVYNKHSATYTNLYIFIQTHLNVLNVISNYYYFLIFGQTRVKFIIHWHTLGLISNIAKIALYINAVYIQYFNLSNGMDMKYQSIFIIEFSNKIEVLDNFHEINASFSSKLHKERHFENIRKIKDAIIENHLN